MKKTLLFGLSILLTYQAIADTQPTLTRDEIEKKNREYLAKVGINIPEYSEINIVSANKYIRPKKIMTSNYLSRSRDDEYMAAKINEYLIMNDEQKKRGYFKENDQRARELMTIKQASANQKSKHFTVMSSPSTDMKQSINDLKIAYTFVGVPPKEIDTSIGVAPYGAYKQLKNGDEANGWDGAVQFFEKTDIGSCAFTEHNRKLSRCGVELIKELVTHEINHKPTIILVKGSEQSGFTYKIKWYDSTFSRELECANLKYSPQLRTKVIELANRIDTYQQQ